LLFICCVGVISSRFVKRSSINFDSVFICCLISYEGIFINDRFVFIVDAPRVNNDVKCSFSKIFNASWFNCWCGCCWGGGGGGAGGDDGLLVVWRRGRRISFVVIVGVSTEVAERKKRD